MLKIALGIVIGIVCGFGAVLASQAVSGLVFPTPRDVDMLDKAAVADMFRSFSPGHFAAILVTYLIGGLAGGSVAGLIARRHAALWVPPAAVALAAALNVFTYPHPVWAQIGGILAPLVGGWIAARLVVMQSRSADASP